MDSGSKAESDIRAGVDRAHDQSLPQKLVFIAFHLASLALCAWVLLGGGLETLGGLVGRTWTVAVPMRGYLILGATALYVARNAITLFYVLQRRVLWSEALSLGFFMVPVEVGYAVLAGGVLHKTPAAVGWLDGVAVALVVVGSYLNTASEVQRKWWKARPENKGHCYTEGLFRYAMHINYFGDVVLFTGWSLLTAVWWTLALPVAMATMFAFMHIPGLDSYMAERYGDEFKAYAARTKKLVPFVY